MILGLQRAGSFAMGSREKGIAARGRLDFA